MRLEEIIKHTNAEVLAGKIAEHQNPDKAFSSDLMSDVLTLDEDNIMLITGLANIQTIRTAEMADIDVVLLARNKKATSEMLMLAEENGLLLLVTPFSMFRISGILYANGLKPVY